MNRFWEDSFSSRQVAKISGLSTAMIDYLCRAGIVAPSSAKQRGRGLARSYTFSDLVILKVVAKLLRAGLSVAKLKKSLIAVRKQHANMGEKAPSVGMLVTDGRTVF